MKQNKKQEKNQKLRGQEGFEEYYKGIFGQRWDKLRDSLFNENDSVEYHIPGAEKSYFLDSASVLAAACLPLQDAERILDLCAAPGGKTIVLASRMDPQARLYSNERSPDRKHRLSLSVESCIPPQIAERITVSCSDGSTWCTRQTECFDRILLDAPCSSERHVISSPKYLAEWSLSRIKTVTSEQWALLSSAYRLLEPNGILLYSTCALCPDENDGMIERLQKKFNKDSESLSFLEAKADESIKGKFSEISFPSYEKTKYGYQILPDRQNGAGPIYFAIIQKLKSINNLQ